MLCLWRPISSFSISLRALESYLKIIGSFFATDSPFCVLHSTPQACPSFASQQLLLHSIATQIWSLANDDDDFQIIISAKHSWPTFSN